MKGIIKLRSRVGLQRLLRYKNFHDVSNASVIKSTVDRASKEFQVKFFKYAGIIYFIFPMGKLCNCSLILFKGK